MPDRHLHRCDVFGDVPQVVHDRLEKTLSGLGDDQKSPRSAWQPILILILALLLGGAAVAAISSWSVRDVLTRQNRQGQAMINENMAQLAQSVQKTVEGKAVRIQMTDALFDGRMLVAAWEIENLLEDRPVYLHASKADNSINWDTHGTSAGMDEYLRVGGRRNASIDHRIYDAPEGDSMHVGIQYWVLAPVEGFSYIDENDRRQANRMAESMTGNGGPMIIRNRGGGCI